jgi:eukaryotic translation initiation factor 2-alpha kinase 4
MFSQIVDALVYIARQGIVSHVNLYVIFTEEHSSCTEISNSLISSSVCCIADDHVHMLTVSSADSRGDCKLGDFGLATTSLESEEPEDQAKDSKEGKNQGLLAVPKLVEPEMTLEVGTRLYIAPEVQRQKGRPRARDHSKADLYSLGVSTGILILMYCHLDTRMSRLCSSR